MITVQAPATERELDAARALFREYAASPEWEASFATYLAQQGFERELAGLGRVYAPPAGRLLLARADGEAAGCVAFKALAPPSTCEMKRLYVRPAFRGRSVGRRLVEALLADAAAAGYERMRLDTLPSMGAAQRLYRSLGFEPIAAYCANPVDGAVFLERALARPAAG